MSDSFTVNFGFTIPGVGSSDGSWGGKLNANLISIDDLVARSLRAPAAFTGEMPDAATRSGKVLAFDGSGNPTVVTIGSSIDPSLRSDLAASGGAALVNWLNSGTSAYAMAVSEKLTSYVDVWDFMSPAMRADVTAGTLLVDCASAFQAAVNYASGKTKTSLQTGITLRIRAGRYYVASAISFDWRNTDLIADSGDLRKITIHGDGSAVTSIHSTSATDTLFIRGYGNATGTELDVDISGIRIVQKLLGASKTGNGIRINQVARVTLRDVKALYFNTGFSGNDLIYVLAIGCDFGANNTGASSAVSAFSNPNSWKFIRTTFGGNQQYGATFTKGANISFDTCAFEGIGSDRASHACLRFIDGPSEGGAQAHIDNCYFENNKVLADISAEWTTADSGTIKVTSCSFNRSDVDRYQARHIRLAQSSSGQMLVNIDSCAFKAFGSYVVAANPVWEAVSPNTAIKVIDPNCYYQNSGEFPTRPATPTVASSGTITLPTTEDVFIVSGTTNITSITVRSVDIGRTVRLMFSGALTVTDGSNLRLNGNFVTTADDVLTLTCFDGTNWHEVTRSAN